MSLAFTLFRGDIEDLPSDIMQPSQDGMHLQLQLTFSAADILIIGVFFERWLRRFAPAAPLCRFDTTGRQVKELRILVIIQVREEGVEPEKY